MDRSGSNEQVGEVRDVEPWSSDVDQGPVGRHPQRRAPDVDLVAEGPPPLRGVQRVQPGDGLAILDDEIQVLTDRDDVSAHRDVPAPGTDRHVAVARDDDGRGAGAQRDDRLAVRVVPTVGVRHQEACVEGRHEALRSGS